MALLPPPPPPIKIHLDYLNCLLVNLLLSIDLKLLNQFLIQQFINSPIQNYHSHNNGEISITQANEYRPLKRVRKNDDEEEDSNQSTPKPEVNIRGISQLISHTLSNIDIDLRASLANNIIVTGGVSLISQLTERLYLELSNNNPGLKIRLHAVEFNRKNQSSMDWWECIGFIRNIPSNVGDKEEYNEVGVDRILNQRFR